VKDLDVQLVGPPVAVRPAATPRLSARNRAFAVVSHVACLSWMYFANSQAPVFTEWLPSGKIDFNDHSDKIF
jgi:hypothetical protein